MFKKQRADSVQDLEKGLEFLNTLKAKLSGRLERAHDARTSAIAALTEDLTAISNLQERLGS